MAEAPEGESKEFAPSPRRLERARERGEVIRSEEVQAAVATVTILGLAWFGGGRVADHIGRLLVTCLSAASGVAPGGQVALALALQAVWPVLLMIAATGGAMLLWLIASGGLVFAPSRLQIKWSRVSPRENAKNRFGRGGLMDFLRRSVKLATISTVLLLYLRRNFDGLAASIGMEAGQIWLELGKQMFGLLALVALISGAIGVLDFLWQRQEFLRRNRMSRKELADEQKESEGDPHLKADRRRRAEEMARHQMLAAVPSADVVIINPSHYAVALKWERSSGRVPVCVAKGADELALRIRGRAVEAGVPLHRDPPTARRLYAVLKLGDEIHRDHYRAVAAAIRFADSVRRRRKGQR